MRNQTLTKIFLGLAFLLGGCQGVQWQPGGQAYTAQDGRFSVRLPTGWSFAEPRSGQVIATADGLLVQRIVVGHRELKEALPYSKRVLTAGLSSLELVEAMTDDLRADHGLLNLQIVENQPATIGGQPGFKLVTTHHNASKLQITSVLYGFVKGPDLYLLNYIAPTRYFYDRDLPGFEEAVKSFQLGKP